MHPSLAIQRIYDNYNTWGFVLSDKNPVIALQLERLSTDEYHALKETYLRANKEKDRKD